MELEVLLRPVMATKLRSLGLEVDCPLAKVKLPSPFLVGNQQEEERWLGREELT